jgi:hypothetical protein
MTELRVSEKGVRMTATIHEGNKLTINTYGVLAAGQLGSKFGGINCSGCAKGQRSLVVVNGFNEEMSRGGRESQRPQCSPSIGAASSQPLASLLCVPAPPQERRLGVQSASQLPDTATVTRAPNLRCSPYVPNAV